MSDGLDRTRLTLPLKSITTRDESDVSEGANIGSRSTQQKLMKSLSTPADYLVSTPVVYAFKPLSNMFDRCNPNDDRISGGQNLRFYQSL